MLIFELLNNNDAELKKQINLRNIKSSGPGGQRANKKSTGVEITLPAYAITVYSKKYRNRSENLTSAFRKLKNKLACLNKELPDEKVISLIRPYISGGKININRKNNHYPLLLAVIAGSFIYFKGDHKESAKFLNVSVSSLLKFIKESKNLTNSLNIIRSENNLFNL